MNFRNQNLVYIYNQVLDDINSLEDETEPCNICKLSIDKYTGTTLSCNHKYHTDCILNSLKKNNNKQCPYCGISIDILKHQCTHIMKTGNQCSKMAYNDKRICLIHIKTIKKYENNRENKINNKIQQKQKQIDKLQKDINNLKNELD